jgi:hypothetical protein
MHKLFMEFFRKRVNDRLLSVCKVMKQIMADYKYQMAGICFTHTYESYDLQGRHDSVSAL